MKRLITTGITSTVGFLPKSGTLDFIQDSYKEIINADIEGSINGYSNSVAYIVSGLIETPGTSGNTNVSAGWVYFNGELYSVASFVYVSASFFAYQPNLITSNYTTNADPVTYTDLSTGNIHQIRSITVTNPGTFSSFPDYSSWSRNSISFVDGNGNKEGLIGTHLKYNTSKLIDPAGAISSLNISYQQLASAVVGAKSNIYFGMGLGTCSVTIGSASNILIVSNGFNTSFTLTGGTGGADTCCIESEYLGITHTSYHVIKITVYQNV